MSLAAIERSERGVSLTIEDEAIEYAVADRNDAALIAARAALAKVTGAK